MMAVAGPKPAVQGDRKVERQAEVDHPPGPHQAGRLFDPLRGQQIDRPQLIAGPEYLPGLTFSAVSDLGQLTKRGYARHNSLLDSP